MTLMLRDVVRQPRVFETGTGKDAFFGDQISERYTAEVCAVGDTQLSCQDLTTRVCSSYTRLFGCCDAVDGGGCGISVGCTHCEEKPTGKKSCECERVVQQGAISDIIGKIGGGAQQPTTFPIGAAGSTVAPSPGKTLTGVLVVAAVVGVGYFLYTRSKRGIA